MPEHTTKDFGSIRDDYTFFENHATEAESDLAGYALHLGTVSRSGPVRLLDFGCGPGTFSARFLARAGFSPEQLRLALVEPVDVYRASATRSLTPFTRHAIEAWPALPGERVGCFDLIVSNHVLYYVPDLDRALNQILQALAVPGLFLTAIAGHHNALIQMWLRGFALLGKPVPFHVAEDVESALVRLGQPFEKHSVRYDLIFDDSAENRMKILRFLFTDHLLHLPREAALDLLSAHAQQGRIVVRTTSDQFVVRRDGR